MAHARALAEHSGLVLKYEKDAVAPRTDGTNIYLPAPDVSWSQDEWDLWRSFLYHEIGHNVPEMKDAMDYIKERGLTLGLGPFSGLSGFFLNGGPVRLGLTLSFNILSKASRAFSIVVAIFTFLSLLLVGALVQTF